MEEQHGRKSHNEGQFAEQKVKALEAGSIAFAVGPLQATLHALTYTYIYVCI